MIEDKVFLGANSEGNLVFRNKVGFYFYKPYRDLDGAFEAIFLGWSDRRLIELANEYDCAPRRLAELPAHEKEKFVLRMGADLQGNPIYGVCCNFVCDCGSAERVLQQRLRPDRRTLQEVLDQVV